MYKEIGHTVDTVTGLQCLLDGMRLAKNFFPTRPTETDGGE